MKFQGIVDTDPERLVFFTMLFFGPAIGILGLFFAYIYFAESSFRIPAAEGMAISMLNLSIGEMAWINAFWMLSLTSR